MVISRGRLRALEEWRSLLKPLDHQGLIAGAEASPKQLAEGEELGSNILHVETSL
jgi:hypothetical protein